ncbi:hypothetical protein DC522_32740 [Microvirga sp. KLBC 81]|nr:hypothetical protein DC522_32740 [Microvirga sp. KLBC 81]
MPVAGQPCRCRLPCCLKRSHEQEFRSVSSVQPHTVLAVDSGSTARGLIMLSGIRVLIVEDDTLVAATLSDAVEMAGGEVVGVAHTVSEAREMVKLLIFDAAVLDLQLPDGDVTPVLEALHARQAPTVVYSGGELPEKVRARHPELVALRKPVLPGRLVAEILRARGKGL